MKHERTIEESIAPMCCVRMGEGVAKVNGESIAPMCCVRMGEGVAKVNGRCFVRTEQTKKQYKDGRSNVKLLASGEGQALERPQMELAVAKAKVVFEGSLRLTNNRARAAFVSFL